MEPIDLSVDVKQMEEYSVMIAEIGACMDRIISEVQIMTSDIDIINSKIDIMISNKRQINATWRGMINRDWCLRMRSISMSYIYSYAKRTLSPVRDFCKRVFRLLTS